MRLFYPSHDIALANGVRHFNPPAAALQLQEDLAFLSDIWNQPFLRGESPIPIPWGWDWDTRRFIHEEYKIAYADLPSDAELEMIRQFSSRKTMIPLADEISHITGFEHISQPVFLDTKEAVENYIKKHDTQGKRFVLKTPWSSSGRGLTLSHICEANGQLIATPREVMMRHALATLKKMGGIMGEEWIENKHNDFALLFHASTTELHFIGYSLFDNDEMTGGTTYRQGYLLSNEEIEQRLGLEQRQLHSLIETCKETLTDFLSPLFGHTWSLGYLGLDFLTFEAQSKIAKPNNGTTIGKIVLSAQPLELNLRTTMGTVCRLYYDQNQYKGLFHITPMREDGHFKAEFLASQR